MTMTSISSPTLTTSSTRRHAVVGQLADAHEAFFAGHDLDEGAEIDRAGDAAGVDLADLSLHRSGPR